MYASPPREGHPSADSALPRALLAMSRPSQFKEFWKLLGRFEHLTVQETLKIQSLDFGALEDSQREKGSLVEVLQELGGRLGLDRSNRDLRLRLETLEQMERRNLDQITASLDAARGQRRDAERTRVNLRSLRSSYLSGSASGEFFAEG